MQASNDPISSPASARRRSALALVLLGAMSALSLVLWIGVPVGWMWVASQFTPDSRSFYLWLLLAIPLSMVAVGWVIYRLNDRYVRLSGEPSPRRHSAWLTSHAADRTSRPPRQAIEVIMACSVTVALLALLVWFFFLAGSPLPPS